MKKAWKILGLSIAAVIVLNLAACSGPAPVQQAQTAAAASAEETTTVTAEAESTAAETETANTPQEEETTPAKADAAAAPVSDAEESDNDLIILYTNDTHGHMDNFTKENDSGKKGLSFASVAALKKELTDQGEKVLLVDAGDHIQGTVYSAVDEGREIIYLMNAAGYDLATLGNHEFDYNCFRMLTATAKAWYPYVSCNLYEVTDGLPLFPAYEEFWTKSGKKVAVIGIGTPDSVSTPVRFEDDQGNRYLDFYGRQDREDLYMVVQNTIDIARYYGADYVIALGHLGVDPSSAGSRSEDVIAHVKGLDAFIDGHSHTSMDKKMVADAEGKEIPLTQTGCYFEAVGKLTLKNDGTIDTELISEYEPYDPQVRELEEKWLNTVNLQLGDQIAKVDFDLFYNDPEDPSMRIIRRKESNLGDLCADAIYSSYNVTKNIECDLAIVNGGGIRSEIKKGAITYLDCKSVHPFGNLVCLVGLTGQQILDMLEWSARQLGKTDPETGLEAEVGSLLHCAGIKYTLNTAIKDTEALDENGNWGGGPEGEYRVRDVMIYNRKTGQYDPMDLEKTYRVAGQNYLLRSLGGGLNMLASSELIEDYSGEDYIILSEYLAGFKPDENGEIKITSAGSPLAVYEGYEINYEDPFGAGRIRIIKE